MTMVDSGIPLGPGLLATWVPLPGPHTKNANARMNTATIATNVRLPTLRSRSLFGMQFSFVLNACFWHLQRNKVKAQARPSFRGGAARTVVSGMLIAAARTGRGCVGWAVGYSASPARKTRTGSPTAQSGGCSSRSRLMAAARTAEYHLGRIEPPRLAARRHRPGTALRACDDKTVGFGHGQ